MGFLSFLLPTKFERDVKRLKPLIEKINTFETEMQSLSDSKLAEKTSYLKDKIEKGSTPESVLAEAFAVMRETADRRLGMINALNPENNFDKTLLNPTELSAYNLAFETFHKYEGTTDEKKSHAPLEADFYNAIRRVYPESRPPFRMRAFDVQLMGAATLYEGKISEMKTGEGKTLVGTFPCYMRALQNQHVHVVTVNDYLAKRDSEWMAPAYRFLGLSVDCIDKHQPHSPGRINAYRSNITFGTNNEFGFDYLRDNMVDSKEHKVQGPLDYCIIDEVDSILIDEARTPLIISGPSESNTEKYYQIDKIIPRLKQAKTDEQGKEIPGTGDFILDSKDKHVIITEDGVHKIEQLLSIENLYAQQNVTFLHHVGKALHAHKVMSRDVDYIVENGQVVIIDEFTGRKMDGRRFSDGLHQAIEAKERVNIVSENQTLASITFQNYFRMYKIIAGMTGTADTEAEEFKKIYDLEVVVIPTNRTIIRKDYPDKIYRTETEKFNAIINEIKEANTKGQPVLIGTASVEKSELLSKMLDRKGLRFEILNAKNHTREAAIIQNAGQMRAITIATNMAGRGTDIKLGKGVLEAGGLKIIGSERNEARRIDNQLRGRAGRQGDIGESIYFLSMEDDLMKRFGASERMSEMMKRLGLAEGEEIQHPWITNAITNAQKKVEGRNFDIRKHLLEYDDVMNTQRKYIYEERDFFLYNDDLLPKVSDFIEEIASEQLYNFTEGKIDETLWFECQKWLSGFFNTTVPLAKDDFMNAKYNDLEDKIIDHIVENYKNRRSHYPLEIMSQVERSILLKTLDNKWKEHLLQMDHLREGITLRSYSEKKPLVEFKREGFQMFEAMILNFKSEALETLFNVRIQVQAPLNAGPSVFSQAKEIKEDPSEMGQSQISNAVAKSQIRTAKIIGRNEMCTCGSGKKYKHCCGK